MQPVTHHTYSGVKVTYIPFSPERLAKQMAFTEITPEEIQLIASYESAFIPRIPAMIDAFYAHLWNTEELRALVQQYSSVEQLKRTLSEYLRWFMRGKIDQEYVDYRYRVGAVHDKIGLPPQWYLGMFHIFEDLILQMIHEVSPSSDQQARAVLAFLKLFSLDMQLAMDAYIQAYMIQRTGQLERLQNMQKSLIASSQNLVANSEELSASSEEMVASCTTVLEETEEMRRHAEEIRRNAEAGTSRMQQVAETIRQVAAQMEAMRDRVAQLAKSSREMELILKTVENIAKQTNLLSLNAAIEAARAGQHGRGFAVVAEEVRKLADKTSVSLREISRLITTSDSHVASVQTTTHAAGNKVVTGMDEAVVAERAFAEIARLVGEEAQRTHAITEAMKALTDMSDHVRSSAEQNVGLANTLTKLANG